MPAATARQQPRQHPRQHPRQLSDTTAHSFPITDEGRELTWQAQADRRYKAGNEFDKLLIEIRKQPRLEDFLLGSNRREIQDATQCGPIVVINISRHRCDAILIG